MKPIIVYVDDEPHNLTVLEAALPDDWEIYTFDRPEAALTQLETLQPWIVISDQRMPGMTGVAFLELAKKIVPNAVRVIVTGYSDEDLVVESVRKAQVFDYIRKPWDPAELEKSVRRGLEFFKAEHESRQLQAALVIREQELQEHTVRLLRLTAELENANKCEREMREELECWVHPFVLWAVNQNGIKFPIKRNIVGITFDIIDSSKVHSIYIDGTSVRSHVIQLFSEAIIRHGGWRESHTGDSAYGHFGLMNDLVNPHDAALAVAREFRVTLKGLSDVHGVKLECGIALHSIQDAVVNIHTVRLNTPKGSITQKSFDTTSIEIDRLHRIEKIAHELPGSNILMSKAFYENLTTKPDNFKDLGTHNLKGQTDSIHLYMIPSSHTTEEDILKIRARSAA